LVAAGAEGGAAARAGAGATEPRADAGEGIASIPAAGTRATEAIADAAGAEAGAGAPEAVAGAANAETGMGATEAAVGAADAETEAGATEAVRGAAGAETGAGATEGVAPEGAGAAEVRLGELALTAVDGAAPGAVLVTTEPPETVTPDGP
jgi:hypothetical protein